MTALPLFSATGKAIKRRFARLWRREDGTATIEFVFCVPIVLIIFMASMESGFYMIRNVMMERGLDLVMRDFRLGRLSALTHDEVRDLVCDASPIITNCRTELKVWMKPISTSTWTMPTTPTYCGDGNGTLTPPTTGALANGTSNQLMYVRVCTLLKPLFPTTGVSLRLRADSRTGDYQVAVATVVVVEPH